MLNMNTVVYFPAHSLPMMITYFFLWSF